jgi:hypothetical protein
MGNPSVMATRSDRIEGPRSVLPGQASLEGLLLVRWKDTGGGDWRRQRWAVSAAVGGRERLAQPVGVPPAAAASAAARCRRVRQALELELLDEESWGCPRREPALWPSTVRAVLIRSLTTD